MEEVNMINLIKNFKVSSNKEFPDFRKWHHVNSHLQATTNQTQTMRILK